MDLYLPDFPEHATAYLDLPLFLGILQVSWLLQILLRSARAKFIINFSVCISIKDGMSRESSEMSWELPFFSVLNSHRQDLFVTDRLCACRKERGQDKDIRDYRCELVSLLFC
jgi:hypothetical protein